MADTWRVETSGLATAVATDNVTFAPAGAEQSDVIVTVSPQARVSGNGGGYRLLGSIGVDGVTYLGRTVADRVLPRGNLDGNAVVIDRLFFIDANASAESTAVNSFGALTEGSASTVNRGLTTRMRLSPYISRQLSPQSSFLARSDNSWVRSDRNQSNTIVDPFSSRVQSNVVRYDYRPTPLGVRAEATQLSTPGTDSGLGTKTSFDLATITLLYAPVPELQLGLIGGRDHAEYGLATQNGTVKGGSLRWTPTERTVLDSQVEKRFFGTGWNLAVSHRSPFIAITGNASKQATTYAGLLAQLDPGATNSVSGLLDSALTTQFPDPIRRADEVAKIIAKYNLPANLSSALALYTNLAQVQQTLNVAVALLGARHTVTVSAFRREGRDLAGPADLVTPLNSADARQVGGTLNVTRRLSTDLTADASFTVSKLEGHGIRTGQRSSNKSARFGATHNLSSLTSLTGGLRYQELNSTGVIGVADHAKATSLYAGVLHRF